MNDEPKRHSSSQAMRAVREKFDSIEENTMPLVRDLTAKAKARAALLRKTPIPREEPESGPTDPERGLAEDPVEGKRTA